MTPRTFPLALRPASLDSVRVEFNEQRLISDAGLLLTATLAGRLGIEEVVNESVWLPYGTPGAALPGRKVMSLVHGMLAGADSIDDMNVLRAGSTQLIVGHRNATGSPLTLDRSNVFYPSAPRHRGASLALTQR